MSKTKGGGSTRNGRDSNASSTTPVNPAPIMTRTLRQKRACAGGCVSPVSLAFGAGLH